MAEKLMFNKYQTQLTTEVIDKYPKEVIDELYEYLNTVPFIQRLVSVDRKYAKDMPRDEENKIIIDLANPHILENMDYFRESAIHYQKYGCYTKLKINEHPQSEYMKWFKRELIRCWEGMVRPEDGEWITGDMYFFLNYSLMTQTTIKYNSKGRKYGIRKEELPECWEGIYWRFHYLHQARYGGFYNNWDGGLHAAEIASRGKGKAHPYSQEVFTPKGKMLWGNIEVGSQLYTSYGDTCHVTDIPFDEEVDIFKITLKDGREVYSSSGHLWNVKKHGGGNKAITVSTKEMMDNYFCNSHPSGKEFLYSIPNHLGVDFPGQEVRIDPYTFGLMLGDGCFTHKSCYYTCKDEDFEEIRYKIPYSYTKWRGKYAYKWNIPNWKESLKYYRLNNKKSEDKFIPDDYKYNSIQVRLEILRGLMDSNGTVNNNGIPEIVLSSRRLIEDIQWLCRSLGFNCNYKVKKRGYKRNGAYKQCLDSCHLTIYTNQPIFKLGRKLSLLTNFPSSYSQSKRDYTKIVKIEYSHKEMAKCVTVDSANSCYLIGDFITTHNSYTLASILERLFTIGIGKEISTERKALIVADLKTYLIDDGTLNKFESGLNHLAKHTQFPQHKDRDSLTNMTWLCGWTDNEGNPKGPQNLVIGQAIGDDADKSRGKRSDWMLGEEFGKFGKFSDWWATSMPNVQEGEIVFGLGYVVGTGGTEGCLTENNYIFDNKGNIKSIKDLVLSDKIIGFDNSNKSYSIENVEHINIPAYKECIRITTNSFRTLECSLDHPILASNKCNHEEIRIFDYIEAGNLKINDKVSIIKEVPIFGTTDIFDSRLLGMLIGDGSYITSPRLHNCDKEILDYVKNKYTAKVYDSYIAKDNRTYECLGISNIKQNLIDLGIFGQTLKNKRIPKDIFSSSKEDICNFIGGLFDIDGNISIFKPKSRKNEKVIISLSSCSLEMLKELQLLLIKLGIYANINFKKPQNRVRKIQDKEGYYSLEISDKESIINFCSNIKLLIKYKQELLDKSLIISNNRISLRKDRGYTFETVKKIEYIGKQLVYNISASDTHTYIGNGIITHNSDFTGALDMIYAPESNHIYGLPNVYDKSSTGNKKTIFFYPAYINYKPYYDENGVSDVIGAMLAELSERYEIKYHSQDPLKITKRKAEFAFTIQDAIMRRDSTIYPVADLNDRTNQLDSDNSALKDMFIGEIQLLEGQAVWKPNSDLKPVQHFPHKDNKLEGCIYIKNMPEKDSSNKVPWGRYIAGCLLPGEKVDTNLGLLNVEDVSFNETLINENGNYVAIDRIIKIYKENEDVYTITPSNSVRSTAFTSEHPILISDRITEYNTKSDCQRQYEFDFKYQKVSTVKEGMWTKVPNKYIKTSDLEFKHSFMNNLDFWWLVGLYLGDGWIRDSKVYFAINKSEEYILNKIENIAKNIFNKKCYKRCRIGCYEISFSCKDLVLLLESEFKKGAKNKKLPLWIRDLHNSHKVSLIEGYLDSDGCLYEDVKHKKFNVNFVSINQELLESFQGLLFSLNIVSSLKVLRKESFNTINNIKCFCKECYQLSLSHNNTEKLYNISNKKSFKINKFDPDKYNNKRINSAEKDCYLSEDSKYVYFKIKKINKSVYTGYVYNFECETHTFLCHNIMTHNCDPYDDDVSSTTSLGSCYILDLWTDDIVAEYTGRPMFADDFYENCRRLLLFYNAECNYENNKKGLFAYFSKHNCLYLLCDVLEFLRDKDPSKMMYGNKSKGTANYSNTKAGGVSAYGRRCIRDFLIKPFVYTTIVEGETGPEELHNTVLNLHRIKFRALLQELAMWNTDGNFDRHDALVMLMLLREDKLRLLGDSDFKTRQQDRDSNYLGNDNFFESNFSNRDPDTKLKKQLEKLGFNNKYTKV